MKLFRERGGASLALPLVLFALLSISSIVFVDAQSFRSSAFDPSFDIDDRGADGSSSSSELLAHQKFASKNLFWGTYRPQLYFGLRPRAPESLLSGLAWFGMGNYDAFANGMRHECAEKDGLGGYGWKWHDGRSFGVQEVRDGNLGGNNVRLETSFYKVTPAGGEEGEEEVGGGSWAARVSGEAIDPCEFVLYRFEGAFQAGRDADYDPFFPTWSSQTSRALCDLLLRTRRFARVPHARHGRRRVRARLVLPDQALWFDSRVG